MSTEQVLWFVPNMSTLAAFRKLLLYFLDEMEKNEAGLLQNIDIEYLHDFRIAVRRIRSALGQIRAVYTQDIIDPFRLEFAWLGDVTTPVRDMDIYLLHFNDTLESLPPARRAQLDPLRLLLQAQHEAVRKNLLEALHSARYRKLKQVFRELLSKQQAEEVQSENAGRPVRVVANESIWRNYRKLMKLARRLDNASPDSDFHEVRKTAKKLRYLMEFFQSLYPGKDMKSLIKHLKVIQDNLGEYQDLCVQTKALNHFAELISTQENKPATTLLAMGELGKMLEAEKVQVRAAFAGCFQAFSRPKLRHRFARLFHPGHH